MQATPKDVAKLTAATSREATALKMRRAGDDLVVCAPFKQNKALEQPCTVSALTPCVQRIEFAGVPGLHIRSERVCSSVISTR